MHKLKCNLCGHVKSSKYHFDVCPYCKGSMYKTGTKLHREGHLIDLRSRAQARTKINKVKSHIHKEANKFYQ
jgi:hypothetical protein